MSTHVYMTLLSCRFDADDAGALRWNAADLVKEVRRRLQPALRLGDAEHHACMAHTALCQLQHGLALAPQLLPAVAWPLDTLQRKLRRAFALARAGAADARVVDEAASAQSCGALLRPLGLLLLGRLSDALQLCTDDADDVHALGALLELFCRLVGSPRALLNAMRVDDAPWHAALADADAAAAAARASQQSAAAAEAEEAAAAEDAEDDDDGINPFDEERAAGWLQTRASFCNPFGEEGGALLDDADADDADAPAADDGDGGDGDDDLPPLRRATTEPPPRRPSIDEQLRRQAQQAPRRAAAPDAVAEGDEAEAGSGDGDSASSSSPEQRSAPNGGRRVRRTSGAGQLTLKGLRARSRSVDAAAARAASGPRAAVAIAVCPPRACEVRLELRSAGSNWSWRGTVALRLRPLAPAEQKPALRIGVCAVALDAAPPAEAWRAVADARAHRRDGRPAEALQASEAGLLVAPRWPPLVRERAEALLALGWFAPAASALSGLAKEAPHDTQLQLLLRGIERCLDAAQRAEAERRPGDAAVAAGAPTTPSRGMLALSSAMLSPGGDADEGSISARLRRFRDEASKGIDSISDLALEAAAERRDKALAAAALAKAMAEAAIDEARDAPSSAAAAEASGDGRSFVDDIAQRFGAALRPRRSSGASGSGAELLRARSVSMGDGGGGARGGGAPTTRRWTCRARRPTCRRRPTPTCRRPTRRTWRRWARCRGPTPPPLRARARSAAAAAELDALREAEEGDDDDALLASRTSRASRTSSVSSAGSQHHTSQKAPPARRAMGGAQLATVRATLLLAVERAFDRATAHAAVDASGAAYLCELVTAVLRLTLLVASTLARAADAATRAGASAPPLLAALADLLRAELELELGGASLADARELLHLLATLEATLAQHGVPPERSALLDAHAVQAAFRAWLHEQRANFEQVLDGSFAQESWAPLTATQRVSASVVDLFQCFTQTVDFFFAVAQPSVSMARYLDWLLQEVVRAVLAYAERIQRRCGDADALLGPVDGALAARLAALTPPALCTMLNNVVSAAAMLEGVWANVDAGWRRAVGEGGLNRRALEDALGLLRGRARTLTTFVARRLVAYQLGDALGAALYARGVREPEQQMAALLPELAEGEAELVGLVLPEHAEPMAFEVLRAALGAFERVLLGGRVYSQRDGEALADDLQTLLDLVRRAPQPCHQPPPARGPSV